MLIRQQNLHRDLIANHEIQIRALNILIASTNTDDCSEYATHDQSDGDESLSAQALQQIYDILHCRTQREAARVIAKANDGQIGLVSAARVIKAAGLSKGLANTIVSSLHNFMTHSTDWTYVGPSRFKLVTECVRDDTPLVSGCSAPFSSYIHAPR